MSGPTAADSSGNGNNGTVGGAAVWQPTGGKIGGALEFDGSDDYVQVADSATLLLTNAATFSAWVSVPVGTDYNVYDYRHILSKGATYGALSADYSLGLSNPDGAVHTQFSDPAAVSETATDDLPITQAEWVLVTATFDGGAVDLYLNASLVHSKVLSFTTIRTSTQPFYIGSRYLGPQKGQFVGLIDDVRIYNRALSAGDVAALYNLGAGTTPPSVVNQAATNVTSNSATLNGEITDTGGENPVFKFYWGDNDAGTTVGNWDNCVDLGTMGLGTQASDIPGLTPGTTYYFRCYAENSAGSSWAPSTASFTTAGGSPVADWPHWRGPARDGTTPEDSGWDTGGWPPQLEWTVNVGNGGSSPVVANGRLYATGWDGTGSDFVYCFDVATGAEIWSRSYPCPGYGRQATGDMGLYKGPSSTPEHDAATGRLYTLSIDGDLYCWNGSDGQQIWYVNLYDQYLVGQRPNVGGGVRDFGYTTSPLVYDNLVLVEVGASAGNLIAFDKNTGAEVWRSQSIDPAGHTNGISPITVGSTPCAAVLTLQNLLVVRLDGASAGMTAASSPWTTDFGLNRCTPTVTGSKVIVTSGYNMNRTSQLSVSMGSAVIDWTVGTSSKFGSAVVSDGYAYLTENTLKCFDTTGGPVVWGGGSFGSDGSCLVTGDDRLIVFGSGKLALVESAVRSPGSYKMLSSMSVGLSPGGFFPPHIVLSGGKVFCKDRYGEIRCYRVRDMASPPPAAPSALTATAVSSTRIDLSWIDKSGDEDQFRIERKTGAAGTYAQIATVGANTTGYSDITLVAGTTYYYRVRAWNASGDSAYSNEAWTTTPSGLVVTNVVAEGTWNYEVDDLYAGRLWYVDRTYTFTNVGSYEGLKYIRTANVDKTNTSPTFLSFDVDRDVTVYVAYDDREPNPPGWLDSWTLTPDIIETDDLGNRVVYSRYFPAGTITLDGNGGSVGYSMYNPIIKAGGTGPANQPPVAYNSNVQTNEGASVDITLNATDPDGDALTFTIASYPSRGALSGSGPTVTYTPDAGYTGADSFTWQANDGQADSNVATVSITVGAYTDTDADGMDDAWEVSYFGDLSHGPSEDPDGDGYTNMEEYQAGTDPTDPASKPGTGPQGSITVTYPNGGEEWLATTTETITWDAQDVTGEVEISYSTDSDAVYMQIDNVPALQGSYEWTVPYVSSTQCRVRVSEVGGGGVSDESDAYFTLAATGILVEPNVIEFHGMAGAVGGVLLETFTVRYVAQAGAVTVTLDRTNMPEYLTVEATGFVLNAGEKKTVKVTLDAPGLPREESIHEYVAGAIVLASAPAAEIGSAAVDARVDVDPSRIVTGCAPPGAPLGGPSGAGVPGAAFPYALLLLAALAHHFALRAKW